MIEKIDAVEEQLPAEAVIVIKKMEADILELAQLQEHLCNIKVSNKACRVELEALLQVIRDTEKRIEDYTHKMRCNFKELERYKLQ